MGTSGGLTDTGDWKDFQAGRLFQGRTIFDQCHDAGLSWATYYQTTPWELCLSSILHNPSHLLHFDHFLQSARNGTLPAFSWINPRSGVDALTGEGSNDAHPSHDLALSEAFLKDIYEAVRASPQYNTTALVVMFDEHGGFWDKVPPPMHGVPAPDSNPGVPVPFAFDRLGLRVPFIVLSPLIPRGTLVSEPPAAQKPFETSQYEHTSVMATFRRMLNMTEGPLTKRDGWAATFEHIFSLKSPRTDAPLHTPEPPPPSLPEEALLPVTDLQMEIFDMHAAVSRANYRQRPRVQGDLHKLLSRHFSHAVGKVKAVDEQFRLRVMALPGQNFMIPKSVREQSWLIGPKRVMSATLAFHGTHYCMTENADATVGVQLCRNASRSQDLMLQSDGSIRDAAGLCLTAERIGDLDLAFFGTYQLRARPCNQSVFQSFSYYWTGTAGSEFDGNGLCFGDGEGAFVITD
jgi:hypothetical protein